MYITDELITLEDKVLSMKTEQEYIKDIGEIRSMMERSTKFLSLSGLSGVLSGVYALIGAFLAYRLFYNNEEGIIYNTLSVHKVSGNVAELILLAGSVLLLAIGTAIYLSKKKAKKSKEKLWNASARRLVFNMAIPLLTGGVLVLIFIAKGILGIVAPLTLIFYGLALINASKYTYEEVRTLGIIEIVLGLISAYFIGFGLFFWAIGFGVMHIIYGIYMHWRYEK